MATLPADLLAKLLASEPRPKFWAEGLPGVFVPVMVEPSQPYFMWRDAKPDSPLVVDAYGWNDAWKRLGSNAQAAADRLGDILMNAAARNLWHAAFRRPSRGWRRHERRRKVTERSQ